MVAILYDVTIMIDIATATPPNADGHRILAVPFDWIMLQVGGQDLPWTDNSNLCKPAQSYSDAAQFGYAFGLETGLHTAVIHSLFTDARAGRDDRLPYGSTDKRGWVGERHLPNNGAQGGAYGSRLWLNYYTVATPEVLEAQRFAAFESLSWLIESEVVDAVEVSARYVHKETFEMLALHIIMRRDGQTSPVYDAVWGATMNQPEGHYAAA